MMGALKWRASPVKVRDSRYQSLCRRRTGNNIMDKKILVVDDEAGMRLALSEVLKRCGYQVAAAHDGIEALRQLEVGCFDLVISDVKMPRMDGIEVLEAIRKDEKLKTLPVVMLTSSREEPDLEKCYEMGVNAYVVKPVDFMEFIEAVRHIGIFWAIINELPHVK